MIDLCDSDDDNIVAATTTTVAAKREPNDDDDSSSSSSSEDSHLWTAGVYNNCVNTFIYITGITLFCIPAHLPILRLLHTIFINIKHRWLLEGQSSM